eukprot:gnl/MRDRNA2_/MRDRNA2_90537_c0_seq1.p1 gnl/MRDRNA2_/MRDRNA2_90537_c0~~gnl/MRDRNA2_/MRDRNA2_90537_c0_seq1.p1  ORF type:complete len:486 (-),score=118.76 gnl/MRDRNA2_/MRDRNA2_90537_c0_seq1:29-1486(-)
MFTLRLVLAFLALNTIVAKVLTDSQQATMLSQAELAHDDTPVHDEDGSTPVHDEEHGATPVHDEEHVATTVHDEGAEELSHAAVQSDVPRPNLAERAQARELESIQGQQLERTKELEHNAQLKLTGGAAETQPVDIDTFDAVDSQDSATTALNSHGTESIEVTFDGAEAARKSPVVTESIEAPQSQTKSTTEILVHPSGEILVENAAYEPSPSSKQRAGTNARRMANAAESGEQHSLPYAQPTAGSVLRQEKEPLVAKIGQAVSTTAASSVLRTEVEPTSRVKTPELKEIRLAAVAKPVISDAPALVSRGHRIPTVRPDAKVEATTTTTAAALAVAEPTPIGWNHGLIPGLLAHLQMEERNIIFVSLAILAVLLVSGICACRSGKGSEDAPEITGSESRPSRGSMFSGLSSVDFVDSEDRGVRAMLQKVWDLRTTVSKTQPESTGVADTPSQLPSGKAPNRMQKLFEKIDAQIDEFDSCTLDQPQ